jgi:flagellar biosynthesis/type III secretory pathway chaperone
MPKPLMPKPLMMAQRLADVLDRENDALRAMDLFRAVTLLPEKTAAIADLTAADEEMAEHPHPDLASITARLDDLAQENRVLLERAIGVQQRVIGIVVRAAASVATAPNYGLHGRPVHLTSPMALSTRA